MGILLCLGWHETPLLWTCEGLSSGKDLGLDDLAFGFEQPCLSRRDARWERVGLEGIEQRRELAVLLQFPGSSRRQGQSSFGL